MRPDHANPPTYRLTTRSIAPAHESQLAQPNPMARLGSTRGKRAGGSAPHVLGTPRNAEGTRHRTIPDNWPVRMTARVADKR